LCHSPAVADMHADSFAANQRDVLQQQSHPAFPFAIGRMAVVPDPLKVSGECRDRLALLFAHHGPIRLPLALTVFLRGCQMAFLWHT